MSFPPVLIICISTQFFPPDFLRSSYYIFTTPLSLSHSLFLIPLQLLSYCSLSRPFLFSLSLFLSPPRYSFTPFFILHLFTSSLSLYPFYSLTSFLILHLFTSFLSHYPFPSYLSLLFCPIYLIILFPFPSYLSLLPFFILHFYSTFLSLYPFPSYLSLLFSPIYMNILYPFSSYIDIYFSSCFMLFPINITAFFEATAISFLHSLSIDQFSLQDILFRFLSQEHAFFHLSSK